MDDIIRIGEARMTRKGRLQTVLTGLIGNHLIEAPKPSSTVLTEHFAALILSHGECELTILPLSKLTQSFFQTAAKVVFADIIEAIETLGHDIVAAKAEAEERLSNFAKRHVAEVSLSKLIR